MKTKEVELYLPKIKLETSMILNQTLIQLGLNEAFKESANVSSLTDYKPIYISNA